MAKIHKIAKQYEGSEIMKKLSQTIEKYVDRLLENTGKNEKDVVDSSIKHKIDELSRSLMKIQL